MVLAIDIGNTTIAFTGLEPQFNEAGDRTSTSASTEKVPFQEAPCQEAPSQEFSYHEVSCQEVQFQELSFQSGLPSDYEICFMEKIPTQTGKDLPSFMEAAEGILRRNVSPDKKIVAAAVSSVVPACTPAAAAFAEKICGVSPVVVNCHCDSGLLFSDIPVPEKVGADRIADAAWAAERYPLPVMTADLGTATTINVVSGNREFLGGMIAAGVRTSLNALRSGTAQLPQLEPGHVKKEDLIGRDTAGCMLSAAVIGAAAMIDGLAAHVEEQLGCPLTLVLTGGNAGVVSEWIRHTYIHEPDLAAKGTALIAQREHAAK